VVVVGLVALGALAVVAIAVVTAPLRMRWDRWVEWMASSQGGWLLVPPMAVPDGSFWTSGSVAWVSADDHHAVVVTLQCNGRFWSMELDDVDPAASASVLCGWRDRHVRVLIHHHGNQRQTLYGDDGRCMSLRPPPCVSQPSASDRRVSARSVVKVS
jgi:hypothetical protein